jgi:hypothetical protein
MKHHEIENILREINDKELPAIFHYEDTPSENEFQMVYDFYMLTLKKFSVYGLVSPLIYFNNIRCVNALACKRKGYSIISFNSGTIIELIGQFNDFKFETESMIFDSFLDTPVNELMKQSSLHFTFYHEMAHLIQDSDYIKSGIEELYLRDEVYDETRHLLEFDADQFSSLCLSSHICQYLKKYEQVDGFVEHVISIAIAAMILYLMSFSGANEDLYFKERKHPHPAIRLSNIANVIINYVFEDQFKRVSHSTERTEILVKAGNIVQNGTKSNIALNYIRILKNNHWEIKEFIEGFQLLNNSTQKLATDEWNKQAI